MRRGLSVPEAAEKAGMNRSYWYQVEKGMRVPGADRLGRFASALGCTVAELAGEDVPSPLTPLQKRALGLLENIPQRRIGEWFAFAGRLMSEDMETGEDFLAGMTQAAS